MNKTTAAKRKKVASAPKSYAEAGDAALTLRVSKELLAKIDANVEALNAQKKGHWSRNAYLVHLLETATESVRGGK
jgi:hypothetical protein